MYKPKEIKNMEFAIYHKTGEYMDLYKLNFDELNEFFSNCEYMFGKKWEPIYVDIWKPNDSLLCHLVNMFYKHGYIVCFRGELDREFNGTLIGHSTLLDYAQQSDYRQKCEKNRLKYIKKKQEGKNKWTNKNKKL